MGEINAGPIASPHRPPYGGGAEEYFWRSRALRWCYNITGAIFILLSLFLLHTAFSITTFWHIAAFAIITAAANLAAGAYFILMPWATLRDAHRRAIAWKTDRTGGPYRTVGSLGISIVMVAYCNLIAPLLLPLALLAEGLDTDTQAVMFVEWGLIQAWGVWFLVWLVVDLWRRRHFCSWRLRLESVPVQPGVPAAFEVFRADGRPLGDNLRFKLVGYRRTRSMSPVAALTMIFPKLLPGDVQTEVPTAESPSSIKGTLRIETTGLSPTPPEGKRYPCRLFAFLRVRQGWWMKCLFEIPMPEVYIIPPFAHRAAAAATSDPKAGRP